MSLTVGMISLGCNKNRVDSEIALGLLKDKGYTFTGDPAEADILMVNTCGFIEAAKEESIDAILEMAEYKQTGRCKLLVVTGCLAQRYEQSLMEEIPEIDLLMGVNQYEQLDEAIQAALTGKRQSLCQEKFNFFEQPRVLTTPGYTAYTRIGDGCNNRCTFCAIPLIRGHYRSRDEKAILGEIESLAKQGVREHILVAQDTTRYGTDWQEHTALPELMEKAAAIDGVDWLRVLYCYPDETDQRLLDVIAKHDNICKYLDLPIQHINDTVLKRMHRRGDSSDIRRCLKLARERGLALRTSIIVGFPGETEEQFQELLDFLQEAQFDRLGAFAYSAEEDTPAARMPDQIPEEVKQERLDRLMTLQSAISLGRNQLRLGKTEKVLVTDVGEDGLILGRSQYEAPETDGEIVFTAKKAPEIGTFVNVKITQAETYDLMGEMQ
ncbi:MAG: 30S ribosomal protein S12 methylthiotransferase RimO [Clostridia bacterium]|nr:30S ribosomal protein S12 methylthiotransferase RimO [Clostridia bacterium]